MLFTLLIPKQVLDSYCVRNAKFYYTNFLLPEVGCYSQVLRGRYVEVQETRGLGIQWWDVGSNLCGERQPVGA